MFDRFTDHAKKTMNLAREESLRFEHAHMGTEHILLGLIQVDGGSAVGVLHGLGAGLGRIRSGVERRVKSGSTPGRGHQLPFTRGAKKVLEFSMEEAGNLGHNYIGTEHLLLGLIKEHDGIAARVLTEVGVDLDEAREELLDYLGAWSDEGEDASPAGPIRTPASTVLNLRAFGEDLTQQARDGVLGDIGDHSEEVDHMIRALCRLSVNSVALVGSPGVGKLAVVRGVAQRINRGDVPGPLAESRLLLIDFDAALHHRHEPVVWIERLVELAKRGNVIPCIPDLDQMVGLMPAAYADLQAHLLHGGLQCVVAGTEDSYAAHVRRHPAASRLFQQVFVRPPSAENSIDILSRHRGRYEEHHWVKIPDEIIRLAVELSVVYLPGRDLPEKAEALLDEAGSLARMRAGSHQLDTRKIDESIAHLRRKLDNAGAKQDIESSKRLRDQVYQLMTKKEESQVEWRRQNPERMRVATVGEQDIYEVLSGWTGTRVEDLQARNCIPPHRPTGNEA